MKLLLILFSFLMLDVLTLYGQFVPGGINYQAVARDNMGNELKNKNIIVRISIISGEPAGDIVYSETHGITTDKFGLFNLVIGQGSYSSGIKDDFSKIEWGLSPHFLKVEVDFGEGYISMGTMQFLAVPYALHSATAANAITTNDYQQLSYDQISKKLSLENGGTIDLSSLVPFLDYKNGVLSLTNSNAVTIDIRDADADPANELQELTYNNYELSVSEGNKVNLTDLLQDLQVSQDHKLKITKNASASEINLNPYLDNTDNQTLRIEEDSLVISGGNKIKIDPNNTNEIQDLSIQEDILKITGKTDAIAVNLSKYLDNTDKQTLQIVGDSLAISGGNKVKVDLSNTNEIQDLNLLVDVLQITGNADATAVNLSKYLDNTDKQTLQIVGDSLAISGGNKVMVDLSNTNEIQDLNLTNDVLKITGNTSATVVDLSKYLDNTDNQTLHIVGDSLSISSGNRIKVDLSDINEIQDLQMESNILKITNNLSANSIDLSAYLDNTDNQQLSISGYDLGLTNGGSINIRPEIIAFRAIRNAGTSTINPGDSILLKFSSETLGIGDNFDPSSGIFTVPAGASGLYRIDVQYQYSSGHLLKLFINNGLAEVLFSNMEPLNGILSYNTILYLNEGDFLNIYLKNQSTISPIICAPAIFSGYRIH